MTTGHNGEDGRRAILPVSACDINASVRFKASNQTSIDVVVMALVSTLTTSLPGG